MYIHCNLHKLMGVLLVQYFLFQSFLVVVCCYQVVHASEPDFKADGWIKGFLLIERKNYNIGKIEK